MLDELVVQERHPALHRRRHTHLVLFHQQLDEVGFEIGVAHPSRGAARHLRAAPERLRVGVSGGQQPPVGHEVLLQRLRKHSKGVEEEPPGVGRERQEGSISVPAHAPRQPCYKSSDRPTQRPGNQTPVRAPQPLVPGGHPIPVVAEKEFVCSLSGQHDLHVLAREPRDEVERDARREGDRLVLVPDEARQRLEELRGRHDHFPVLGSDGTGREPGVR